jgi:hypothetical protein
MKKRRAVKSRAGRGVIASPCRKLVVGKTPVRERESGPPAVSRAMVFENPTAHATQPDNAEHIDHELYLALIDAADAQEREADTRIYVARRLRGLADKAINETKGT